MENRVFAFQNFLPGNHLLLGAAGVGKTRLLWSLLQDPNFRGENTVNILLTDSKDRFSQGVSPLHVVHVDPYTTDLSWISAPTKPGIYFSSCPYTPRNTTFMECLANYVRQIEGNIGNPIRLFLDFSVKHWQDVGFVEQLNRLHFISKSVQEGGFEPLSIWSVLTNLTDLPPHAQGIWKDTHLLLLSPIEPPFLATLNTLLERTPSALDQTSLTERQKTGEFFYLPYTEEQIYSKQLF